jgi:predicted GIY-YIG superfamily endonuclease
MSSPVSKYSPLKTHAPCTPPNLSKSTRKPLLFGASLVDEASKSLAEPLSPALVPQRKITPIETPTRPDHIKADAVFRSHVSPGGTVSLPIPRMSSGACVYALFDKDTGKTYKGSTTQEPYDRLAQHAFYINHPENRRAKGLVYQELAKNPLSIRIALEHHGKETEDLAELERKHIAMIPEHLKLNANIGGGGGLSLKAAQAAAEARLGPSTALPACITTPEKSYTFKKKADGRIVCDLTPRAKKKEGVVYSITSEEGSYSGYTTRATEKRIREHANQASTPSSSDHPLYKALKEHPEKFSLQIHASGVEYPSHLIELEAHMIQHKKSKGPVFNQNQGRGGCFKRR